MEHWGSIRVQRLALADQLDGLDPGQWSTPSLCGAWDVHQVAAHLIVPHVVTPPTFLKAMVRARGRFERANVAMTARVATATDAELVADLRRYADSRAKPPIFTSVAPLTEILVHGQDIQVPLGLEVAPVVDLWRASLAFLVQPRARRGFVSRRLDGLRLVASDCEWAHGTGDEVRGPARALALGVLGRTARRDELSGPGASRLGGSTPG
jgi:uncharacterized protein (TIGR03083 family)